MNAGKFCWFDLMTTDVAASRAFHAALFGWRVEDHDAAYAMVHEEGGRTIAGMMAAPPGAPSAWLPYVSTDDVAATTKRIEARGGRIFTAHEAPGVGRFAIFADAQGAVCAAFQPLRDFGPYPREKAKNHLSWAELHTPDPAGAAAFYADVFGFAFEAYGPDYLMLTTEHTGGIAKQRDPGPPHWLVYANVASAAATTAKATELGGKVLVPPTPMPPTGTFSILADPTGAVLALMESAAR
jgi:hypothetical protein